MVYRGRGSWGLAFLDGLFYMALRCVLVERRDWVVRGESCGVQSAVERCCIWLVECAVVLMNILLIDTLLIRTKLLLSSCILCNMLDNTSVLVGYYLHVVSQSIKPHQPQTQPRVTYIPHTRTHPPVHLSTTRK